MSKVGENIIDLKLLPYTINEYWSRYYSFSKFLSSNNTYKEQVELKPDTSFRYNNTHEINGTLYWISINEVGFCRVFTSINGVSKRHKFFFVPKRIDTFKTIPKEWLKDNYLGVSEELKELCIGISEEYYDLFQYIMTNGYFKNPPLEVVEYEYIDYKFQF